MKRMRLIRHPRELRACLATKLPHVAPVEVEVYDRAAVCHDVVRTDQASLFHYFDHTAPRSPALLRALIFEKALRCHRLAQTAEKIRLVFRSYSLMRKKSPNWVSPGSVIVSARRDDSGGDHR